MIAEVTRYQTKDGQLHEDEDTARQHVVESLFNTIGPIIDQSGIGFRDRMRVVESLVGTPEKALSLKRLLEAMV